MGDHGESLGEHGEMTHGIFLYDATLHVPLIVAGPDVPHGKVIDDQVRSIDLHPTVMEFLHLAPSRGSARGQPLAAHAARNPRALELFLWGNALPADLHGMVGTARHAHGRVEIHPGAAP